MKVINSKDFSDGDHKKSRTEREEVVAVPCSRSNLISSLPQAMVLLILHKFSELVDHVRFAAVCKDWRSFSEDYNHAKKVWRLHPMLDLADWDLLQRITYPQENFTVYKISDDVLPSYNGKKLVGASHGWLATVELVDQILTITLMDNFTEEASPVILPPLAFDFRSRSGYPGTMSYSVSHVRNIILSADPRLNPENYFAMVFYSHNIGADMCLAFNKGGQNYWIYCTMKRFTSAVFYKNNVYAVETDGTIMSIDIGRHYSLKKPHQKVEPLLKRLTRRSSLVCRDRADMEYLVESTKGNLWHIRRFSDNDFEVYKVVINDMDGTILERARVVGIGDEALFVGGINHPVSITASKLPRCQPNSIYVYYPTRWNLLSSTKKRFSFRWSLW